MAMFRKAAEFLGLVDDDAVDDYDVDGGYLDDEYDPRRDPREPEALEVAPVANPRGREPEGLRVGSSARSLDRGDPATGSVTVVRGGGRHEPATMVPQSSSITPRPAGLDTPSVRAMPTAPAANVHVCEPRSFNDAQEIGDRLKSGQPVIMNLQHNDRELQRRLIDFASGLCYALSGTMSKAADQVFLLTPANVDVSDADVERLSARGLYRAR